MRICQICRRKKDLSNDHVPPRGAGGAHPVRIYQRFEYGKDTGRNKNFYISQNGIKFKTICRDCNSLMGREYDIALNEFVRDIHTFLSSKLFFPDTVKIKTKPYRIFRALLGHILAAKLEIDNSNYDELVRSAFWDDYLEINPKVNLFYWVYPYHRTSIARDIVMFSRRGVFNDPALFQIIKFYPIGFVLTENIYYEGLYNLNDFLSKSIDDEVMLPVKINEKKDPLWPDLVDEGNVILCGESGAQSIDAIRHKKYNSLKFS